MHRNGYLTQREVQRQFRKRWNSHCNLVPTDQKDEPAMRQAFSFFVDGLARDGRITERVASQVTPGPRYKDGRLV